MGQTKVKKEQPRVVLVLLRDGAINKDEVIKIPPGWKFVKKYAGDPKLVDDKGRTQTIFIWPLGSSATYTYLYDDDPRLIIYS